MENQKSNTGMDVITLVVVFVVVVILIISKASEIKKENTSLRQGSDSTVTK